MEFLRRDLVGPAHGAEEVLEEPPRIRYGAGVLFPRESIRNESAAVGGVDEDSDAGAWTDDDIQVVDPDDDATETERGDPSIEESEYDDTVTYANTMRPSAMGISFMVDAADGRLRFDVKAAIYDTEERTSDDGTRTFKVWKRRPLEIQSVHLDIGNLQRYADRRLVEGLRLRVIARPREPERFLVTASVYNETVENHANSQVFFQVSLEAVGAEALAPFVEYRFRGEVSEDEESMAFDMLYRNRRVFAIGHGCAAEWDDARSERTTKVRTEVLPGVTIPPIRPLDGDQIYFDMQFLSGDVKHPATEIPETLSGFCDAYEQWIVAREEEARSINSRFAGTARRHLELCRIALKRMRSGIEVLASDDTALESFMLVNRVMLMQQHHAHRRRSLEDSWERLPSFEEYESDWSARRGFWRAFQLGFILLTIPGIVSAEEKMVLNDKEVPARDVVDLIWFPTGGGKTEAYLGLVAFTIFHSRLKQSERSGCRALMRYTLRLLTSQQFQRAASMICACEVVRRRNPERFGTAPISLGLWVGMSLTPNKESDALRKLAKLDRRRGEAKNPFQILSCPWCGTKMNDPDCYGYHEFAGRQVFLCPSKPSPEDGACPFSVLGDHLPICVVDESIYERPPTLIIGTVDKFAMLAWRERSGRIFEVGGGPDLIIQDELHLISGPLGSMVGLYESAIDALSSREGRRPKIVASTATIRRAEQQCRNLYDRHTFQFPPPGLEVADSFFAREDREDTGRVYVGFLPAASSSPLTAQIRTIVALQQSAALALANGASPDAVDPYWTLVQYFSSLKELGRAATFLSADIPEFLPTMHRRYGLEGKARRWMRRYEELTSRRNEEEIPRILEQLEVPYQPAAKWYEQALDTILATSMISVGVDVDRLGLMMVVTQPKGTSEYIQASSRVGRSRSGPGLIFTLYNPGRPRDRSHHEQFRGYHEAFYRFVEPTSVTPFAPPALERALHAVLVIAGRHMAKWKRPSDFNRKNPKFIAFLEFLRDRVDSVDPDHVHEFEELLQLRLKEWDERIPQHWGVVSGVVDEPVLMRVAGTPAGEDDRDSWEVPTSLRTVDVECGIEVIRRYRPSRPGGL